MKTLSDLRCMECFGMGRVAGLCICEKCLSRKPESVIQRKLQTNEQFRRWWNVRAVAKSQPKPENPKERVVIDRSTVSNIVMTTILQVVAESDHPLALKDLERLCKAKRPDRTWNTEQIFWTALRYLRQEGLIGWQRGNHPEYSRATYLYFSVQQQERQSA